MDIDIIKNDNNNKINENNYFSNSRENFIAKGKIRSPMSNRKKVGNNITKSYKKSDDEQSSNINSTYNFDSNLFILP